MIDNPINRQREHFDFDLHPNLNYDDSQKLQMLRCLRDMCKDCVICNLGRTQHIHNNKKIENQHVLSNMQISKIFVVGQNPGMEECELDEPFVGASGNNFNKEIAKYGINRSIFWISNILKCHTPENRAPTFQEIQACEIYIRAEIVILKPKLIVSLGSFAFKSLCPGKEYSDGLGKITKSKFEVPVYAIYHPSPRNLEVVERRVAFEKQVRILCQIINKLNIGEANI